MKFFAFIFSFLMIGLSVLPCADEGFVVSSAKSQSEISNQHDEQEDHDDACSPFCHCTCCTGFSINHLAGITSSPVLFGSKLYSSYLPGDLISYSLPVWQPPKTG